jgi:hypothetical protein
MFGLHYVAMAQLRMIWAQEAPKMPAAARWVPTSARVAKMCHVGLHHVPTAHSCMNWAQEASRVPSVMYKPG